MQELRQSTAITTKIGPFMSDADGKTPLTALTIARADVKLSKNGGTYTQKTETTSCTHDVGGEYGCPLDATDTATLGTLTLLVEVATTLPVKEYYSIITAEQWDTKYGSDRYTVDLQAGQSIANTGGVAVTSIATDAITAASIKADAVTELATGVWTNATRTLSAFGTLAADVWAVTTRALTDKLGFGLAADQSAVTIGTVNTIASGGLDAIPTETGSAGTLDDTLSGMARALRVRVNDLDAGNYTSEEMYDWINLAYRETVVASKCHKQRVEISLTDGLHTYDWGDIFEPISVMVGGKVIDKNSIKGLGINLKTWDDTPKGTPTDWIHLTGSFIRYYPTPGTTPGKSYVYGFAMPDVLTSPSEVAVAVPMAFRMSAILDRAEAEARKSRSTTANNTALYSTLMESWRGWCVKIADSVRSEG